MSSFIMCKGTSGTGKGTRISQLQMFFKHIGLKHEMHWVDDTTKIVPVCLVFPEVNMAFLGKWVKSQYSKLWSWTSLDYIHARFQFQYTPGFITEYKNYNLVAEGYPMTLGSCYRFKHIHETFGFTKQFYQYYHYDLHKKENTKEQNDECFEQLQGRMMERSGHRIKGSCWGSNWGAYAEYETHQKEHDEDPRGVELKLSRHRYDDDINVFGASILPFIGRPDLVEAFHKYCLENNTLRKMGDNQVHNEFVIETLNAPKVPNKVIPNIGCDPKPKVGEDAIDSRA
jgi:hypothetical protein